MLCLVWFGWFVLMWGWLVWHGWVPEFSGLGLGCSFLWGASVVLRVALVGWCFLTILVFGV